MVKTHLITRLGCEQCEQKLVKSRDNHVGLPGVQKEILGFLFQVGSKRSIRQAVVGNDLAGLDVVAKKVFVFLCRLVDNGEVGQDNQNEGRLAFFLNRALCAS